MKPTYEELEEKLEDYKYCIERVIENIVNDGGKKYLKYFERYDLIEDEE